MPRKNRKKKTTIDGGAGSSSPVTTVVEEEVIEIEVIPDEDVQKLPKEVKETIEDFKVLDQNITLHDGRIVSTLQYIDRDRDVYKKEKKSKVDGKIQVETKWILKRDAIKRISDAAGLTFSKVLVIAPSIDNNYLTAFDVTVVDPAGKSTTMLGEASNDNTRGVSKMYKALTAERRGFVRAVLNHLGITNIYGEDEFVEEDDVEIDDSAMPSKDEFEEITQFANKILNAETKEDLQSVGEEIKAKAKGLSDKQMNYLRKLYEKNLLRFEEGI